MEGPAAAHTSELPAASPHRRSRCSSPESRRFPVGPEPGPFPQPEERAQVSGGGGQLGVLAQARALLWKSGKDARAGFTVTA
jgi:hypothetical protein